MDIKKKESAARWGGWRKVNINVQSNLRKLPASMNAKQSPPRHSLPHNETRFVTLFTPGARAGQPPGPHTPRSQFPRIVGNKCRFIGEKASKQAYSYTLTRNPLFLLDLIGSFLEMCVLKDNGLPGVGPRQVGGRDTTRTYRGDASRDASSWRPSVGSTGIRKTLPWGQFPIPFHKERPMYK